MMAVSQTTPREWKSREIVPVRMSRNVVGLWSSARPREKIFAASMPNSSSGAPGTGNKDTYPHRIISTPFIGDPGSICSETYLCMGPLDSQAEAESVLSYLSCRLTRLLILLYKPSQHVTRKVYNFLPTQKWTKKWTDHDLYAKYGVFESEIAFIETIVRPMDLTSNPADEVVLDDDE
jgi:hypothetical protein